MVRPRRNVFVRTAHPASGMPTGRSLRSLSKRGNAGNRVGRAMRRTVVVRCAIREHPEEGEVVARTDVVPERRRVLTHAS